METKTQAILISLLVLFLGSNLLSLGITAVITSSYPNTTLNQCEDKLVHFLNVWGITSIVFGSLFLLWFCIQSAIFILKLTNDFRMIWFTNLFSIGIISAILFGFAVRFLGTELFSHICINKIRYYYWSVGCTIFSISLISTIFICSLICISSN